MVDSPEKLSNNHTHDTQSFCLANPIVELTEHGSQPRTIGQLEGLTGKLVESLAQGSSMQSVISSATAVLQSADEMKVAELNDPTLWAVPSFIIPEISSETEARIRLWIAAGMVVKA
jgi:hypothetical protein